MKNTPYLQQLGEIAKQTGLSKVTLRQWHLLLAGLYLGQGLVVWLLSSTFYLPVVTLYQTTDSLQTRLTGQQVVAPAIHQLFSANLAYLVILPLLVAALAHFLCATSYYGQMKIHRTAGFEPLRWIEYGINGSLILFTIGFLAGVQDIVTLSFFAASVMIACLGGAMLEVYKRAKYDLLLGRLSAILSIIVGFLPWLVIGWSLLANRMFGMVHTPAYVFWLITVMFVLFIAVAANTHFQITKYQAWKKYAYADAWYIALGFVTLSAFAWLVFAGALYRG